MKVELTDDGCWHFAAAHTDRGYGRIWRNGRFEYPHRVTYEAFRGPIPEGLDLDHLCRNHACCNPFHLEAVTRRENLMRGDTLTRAHHDGRDCGFPACPSCERFRTKAAAS
jgi:hypothetical protein